MDLRLHDPDRSAEIMRGLDGFLDGEGRDAAMDQLLAEIRRDLLADGDERLHRGDRLVEHFALGRIELDLDHALDALRADHDWHAGVEPTYPVLAVGRGRAR